MSASDWLFLGITMAALIFAVTMWKISITYKQQVENVQMAAGVARESASAFRHTAEALRKVVRVYEGYLKQAYRRIEVVEEMNRMLLDEREQRIRAAEKRRASREQHTEPKPPAQTKPRTRRAPAKKKG